MTNQFERPMDIESLESLSEDVAVVLTKSPLPPGSRILYTINGVSVHAKVAGIKKRSEGLFAVTSRVNSLTKDEKQKLLDAL